MLPTLSQRARQSEDVLFQEVGGEAVLLDLASESYFGLDPVGTRFWSLLEGSTSLASVHQAMLAEYDVEPGQLESDLLALVSRLAEAGLVTLESP